MSTLFKREWVTVKDPDDDRDVLVFGEGCFAVASFDGKHYVCCADGQVIRAFGWMELPPEPKKPKKPKS